MLNETERADILRFCGYPVNKDTNISGMTIRELASLLKMEDEMSRMEDWRVTSVRRLLVELRKSDVTPVLRSDYQHHLCFLLDVPPGKDITA